MGGYLFIDQFGGWGGGGGGGVYRGQTFGIISTHALIFKFVIEMGTYVWGTYSCM